MGKATGKSGSSKPVSARNAGSPLSQAAQQAADALISATHPGKTASHDPHGDHTANQAHMEQLHNAREAARGDNPSSKGK